MVLLMMTIILLGLMLAVPLMTILLLALIFAAQFLTSILLGLMFAVPYFGWKVLVKPLTKESVTA